MMNADEIITELEQVRLQLYRIRMRNKRAVWFCHLIKTIEILVKSTQQATDHVTRAMK